MVIDDRIRVEAAGASAVAHQLARLLADTHVLSVQTQGCHWNVTGPHFRALHLLFEEQYAELAAAADEIAERIRSIGPMAPGTDREMARLTSLTDDEATTDAATLVRRLIVANQVVMGTAQAALDAAEAAGDPSTLDLATRRITVHEKALWMLRATLVAD